MAKLSMRPKLQISQEAIDRQSGDLFAELTDTLEGLMQLSILDQNDINQSRLKSVVRKYTGMDVTFTLIQNTYDAYVHLVQVDKNHVFFQQRSKLLSYYTDNYNTTKTETIGNVDLKNGTVSGVFSKFPVKVGLGSLYLRDIEGGVGEFTAGEVAAVLIHELGHAFTTFEYLGKTVMTGLVISGSVRSTVGIADSKERTKVIMKAANASNVMVDEAFVEKTIAKHGENSDLILLTEHVKNLNSLTKTNVYDSRNCEQIADQFAVKHGAGPALAKALEKLHKFSYDINYRSTPMYVTLEVMKIISIMFFTGAILVSGPYSIGFGLTLLISHIPGAKIYDDPKDRLIFLKRQLIDDLKKLNMQDVKNKDQIKDIVDSIECIEARIDDVKDRKTWAVAFWDAVTPWGRNREQQEAKAKKLEESLNNDLFVKAAVLATN